MGSRGLNSHSDQDGESHVRTAEHFYQNPQVFALTASFPVYESLCLAVLQSFAPSSYDHMIPNTPERLSCSDLASAAVPAQAFQQEGSVYGRMPESLFLFLPLYTAQRPNERSIILRGLRELSADVKQHNPAPTSCFSARCWGREEGNETKWNLLSVNAQRLDGTVGSGGCVNAAHRGATAEQEDIPSPAFKLINVSSVVLTTWCGVAAQMLPWGPRRLRSMCQLWALCTSLPLVLELANS